jgi:tRNA dimethylallyltransferase
LQRGAAAPLPFALRTCALVPERAAQHAAIEKRFDAMLAAGLVEELRTLRKRHRLSAELPSMRAVGYRQVWEFLEGVCDAAGMRSRAIAATRQLAKRQITWLRSFPELVFLDAGRPETAALALQALLSRSS